MKKLFKVMVSPSREFYGMSRCDPGPGGIGILILAVLSCVTAFGLVIRVPPVLASFMLTWSVLARILVIGLLIFLASALYHYFASMLGGRGEPGRTFKGMLYTLAPFCFLVPAALICRVWGGTALYLLFFMAALVYAAVLQFKLISYFYGLTASRSVTALLLPWIIFVGAAGFSVIILSAGVISAAL